MTKIKAHNAPAFVRHLQTLATLTNDPNVGPYPFDIWQELIRLERRANRITTAECNGTIEENKADKQLDQIKAKVCKLLPGLKTVFINGDPRGYALKIKEEEARSLNMWQDWGGYGILAPEF